MRCTSPRTVGFLADGKTISWSPKNYSKQYSTFQLPCGKCLSCRLEYSRQWAVRCIHEAQMYEKNTFLTLTYDEQNLKSENLVYTDFQTFVKNLRSQIFQQKLDDMYPNDHHNREAQRKKYRALSKETKKEIQNEISISIFVTGEYGDPPKRLQNGTITKGWRPHWHALIFNWRPLDGKYKYSNDRGDKNYSSENLKTLWPHGSSEFGDITFHSAGYVARYSAKKLIHGNDGTHQYEPISKKSARNAIGKKWLEKYWTDVFNTGRVALPNGESCGIPRYYEKWLKKHKPREYDKYITRIKSKTIEDMSSKSMEEKNNYIKENLKRTFEEGPLITRNEIEQIALEKNFNELSKFTKL